MWQSDLTLFRMGHRLFSFAKPRQQIFTRSFSLATPVLTNTFYVLTIIAVWVALISIANWLFGASPRRESDDEEFEMTIEMSKSRATSRLLIVCGILAIVITSILFVLFGWKSI